MLNCVLLTSIYNLVLSKVIFPQIFFFPSLIFFPTSKPFDWGKLNYIQAWYQVNYTFSIALVIIGIYRLPSPNLLLWRPIATSLVGCRVNAALIHPLAVTAFIFSIHTQIICEFDKNVMSTTKGTDCAPIFEDADRLGTNGKETEVFLLFSF